MLIGTLILAINGVLADNDTALSFESYIDLDLNFSFSFVYCSYIRPNG